MECDEILDLIKREMSDDITEVIGFRDKTTIFIEKLKMENGWRAVFI